MNGHQWRKYSFVPPLRTFWKEQGHAFYNPMKHREEVYYFILN